eukprot:TRINITY_DN738_c0_g1_i12.p1 TRINITY_DN738_c0_g1~~TRINITY_DN738_c0_g1_i12.p1  ORF type:complete len:112 (-),score=3.64 TRINITY_DN738_c0_g1_i12:305-640(-)
MVSKVPLVVSFRQRCDSLPKGLYRRIVRLAMSRARSGKGSPGWAILQLDGTPAASLMQTRRFVGAAGISPVEDVFIIVVHTHQLLWRGSTCAMTLGGTAMMLTEAFKNDDN